MSALQPLQDIIDNGQQPVGREFWLSLDMTPNRANGLQVLSSNLPTDHDCRAVSGLDVILTINGHLTKYGVLSRLCGSILAARPRRFQVIDFDYKKVAYLRLGGASC